MSEKSAGAGHFDVVVVGARCAGAPTAMLLAQRGLRVLLVDRASFPSDTLSTHLVHPPGVAALRRWGVLDEVVATGCPPIDHYLFDFGPLVLAGAPGTADSPVSYAPRRTVLDVILVRAASRAGAEVREGFTVTELLRRDGRVVGVRGHETGGRPVDELAEVVVGADGLRSLVAAAVDAPRYQEKPRLLAGYYSYWSGLPMEGRFETYMREGRAFGAWPTNDDLTLVIGGWPFAEFHANKADHTWHYLSMFELAPSFAERMVTATRETKVWGTAVPNFFRKPYGPGWALVGDAGYHRDFITAQGMQDAFRDAELCAEALADAHGGRRGFDEAMRDYQVNRDSAVTGMYELTTQLATLEPPPAPMQAMLASLGASQDGMDLFARVNAGTTPTTELEAWAA